jgi:hypothetical protein
MNSVIKIEVVIRKKIVKEAISKFADIISEFKTFESEERCVLDIDVEWEGLRNGALNQIIKEFGEGVYIALAYYTVYDNELVVDIEGNPVDKYSVAVDGISMYKYVKKKLMIIKTFDKEDEKFEIKAYMINVELVNPVIKIVDSHYQTWSRRLNEIWDSC